MKTKNLVFVTAIIAVMLLAVPVLVEAKPGNRPSNILQWWDASDQATHGGDCSPYVVYITTTGKTTDYRYSELDSWCYCGDRFVVGSYSGYIGYETYWKDSITNDDFPYNDDGTQCSAWGQDNICSSC